MESNHLGEDSQILWNTGQRGKRLIRRAARSFSAKHIEQDFTLSTVRTQEALHNWSKYKNRDNDQSRGHCFTLLYCSDVTVLLENSNICYQSNSDFFPFYSWVLNITFRRRKAQQIAGKLIIHGATLEANIYTRWIDKYAVKRAATSILHRQPRSPDQTDKH